MYKKTKEKSELILKLFNERLTLAEICEGAVCSQTTVKKALTLFEIDYDKWVKDDYEQRLKNIVTLYNEGKSQIYIEQTLRLTRKTIRNILKSEEGLIYKSKSDQWRLRWGNSLNEDCFDELTPNAMYWLGFLHADGHVRFPGKEVSIELGIHSQDTLHMEKYKLFLGCDKSLYFPPNKNIAALKIYSKKIYNRLHELGFKHDKSYSAKPHYLLKNSRDFWRGAVDGDGGVYNRIDTPHLFMCGTLETVFDFIIFCSKFIDINDKYPSKANGKELYQVSYYGQDAIKIANFLYNDSETYLDRKYQKYLEIKDRAVMNKIRK